MTDRRRHEGSRRLSVVLAVTPGLAALHERAAQSRRAAEVIAPVCLALLPGFDPRSPGNSLLRGDRLRLHAKNAPQAAKLRQSIPAMRKILHAQGFEGIEIELIIQPAPMPYPGGGMSAGAQGPTPKEAAQDHAEEPRRMAQLAAMLEFSRALEAKAANSPLGAAAGRLHARVKQHLVSASGPQDIAPQMRTPLVASQKR